MSWQDFTGVAYDRDGFVARMNSLNWTGSFKPIGIILHNTAAPTLAQWAESGKRHDERIQNLKSYYQNDLSWSAGPHWFVSRHYINEFMNPTTRGTHSPSFNMTHFGVEMVGDYDREEFNSGDGALVRDNAIFIMAYLCRRFGWDPGKVIKLHKEDPKTTHACPGKKVIKSDIIERVRRAMDGTVVDDSVRAKMAKYIIDFEARRDSAGHLQVYSLPAGDEGGTYEVAGFNDRYHPTEAAELRALIMAGKYDEAEQRVGEYVLRDTADAAEWTSDPGVEFILRDCIHHRGKTGAAKILQRALDVAQDGQIGPKTLAAAEQLAPIDLLTKLRAAREEYELATYGKREQFWKGFTNRWNRALQLAKELSAEDVPVEEKDKPVLRKPSEDAAVRDLQRLLGFDASEIDGDFGPKTEMAVKWAQRRSGLVSDGVVDDATWAALDQTYKGS